MNYSLKINHKIIFMKIFLKNNNLIKMFNPIDNNKF